MKHNVSLKNILIMFIVSIPMFVVYVWWVQPDNVKEGKLSYEIYIPEPYYQTVAQVYGISNLETYLGQWKWKREYEAHKFDCTEMSAFLEYKLENAGFHTVIVTGEHGDIGHAWLEVETNPNQYMIVEATELVVVWDKLDNYIPSYKYETIYDAMKVNSTAFDWWK